MILRTGCKIRGGNGLIPRGPRASLTGWRSVTRRKELALRLEATMMATVMMVVMVMMMATVMMVVMVVEVLSEQRQRQRAAAACNC